MDLRRDRPERQSWISPPLKLGLLQIWRGRAVIAILNRRGYAPRLVSFMWTPPPMPKLFRMAGGTSFCGRLDCHHCGLPCVTPKPARNVKPEHNGCLWPGVERLVEEVSVLPEARIGLMTSDTIRGPNRLTDLVSRVQNHEIDVLVGTQLVAKGHHFPLLTLVGIVDADLGLNGGDLRAAERTYQILQQVSGRAGRAERPGRVLLQTYQPEHPVMRALAEGDRDNFLSEEARLRETGVWPPFGRLAALILSGRAAEKVEATAEALAEWLKQSRYTRARARAGATPIMRDVIGGGC